MYEDGASECYVTAVYTFIANDETEPLVRGELVEDIAAFTDDQGMDVAIFPGDLLEEIRQIAVAPTSAAEQHEIVHAKPGSVAYRLIKIRRLLEKVEAGS